MEKEIKVTNHGYHIESANILDSSTCSNIINFIEDNLDKFELNDPTIFKGYNTNSYKLALNKFIHIDKFKEIDNIIFKAVGDAIKCFIIDDLPDKQLLLNDIADSGYELRKIIGATHHHVDSHDIRFVNDKVSYRVATLVISLIDSGDKLIFPGLDITVPLKEGTFVFFPPYWTHSHYTQWSGSPSYRIQTWLLNNLKVI